MSGMPLPYVILTVGILIAAYAIAGGLEAVIYTDVLQGLALIFGVLICVSVAGRPPSRWLLPNCSRGPCGRKVLRRQHGF